MLTWTQIYTPVAGNLLLSALVAALPVVVLLGLLAFFHVKAHKAALDKGTRWEKLHEKDRALLTQYGYGPKDQADPAVAAPKS